MASAGLAILTRLVSSSKLAIGRYEFLHLAAWLWSAPHGLFEHCLPRTVCWQAPTPTRLCMQVHVHGS